MVDNKRETGAVVTQHSAEEVSFRSTRRTMNGCLFFAILALLPLKSAAVCSPLCDEVTAVCVDDTDEPAHCICYFGYSTSNATNSTSCTAIDTFASAVTNDTPSTPAFSDGTKSIINYVQYVLTFWVIAWCLATIVVCAVYRAWGHHRGIHLVEELTLIITYILIGCLAMNLAGQATACKIVSALTHYVFLCTMTAFVFEGLFAFSLVTGITPNNGYLPPILNYFLILLLPLIPFGASFGPLFAHYGTNGIQYRL
uniref:Extracellular membrane protein CFEM domain-containing protein n=1 Tax=Plectus sambesii TaxID=2011161 RepID=A0A914WN30_9BILA